MIKTEIEQKNKLLSANELYDLSTSEIRKEITRLRSLANKRITRLENSDLPSTALEKLKYSRGDDYRFKANKNYNKLSDKNLRLALGREYNDLISFIYNKTSTVSGNKKYLTQQANLYGMSLNEYANIVKKVSKMASFGQFAGDIFKYNAITNDIITGDIDIEDNIDEGLKNIQEELDDFNNFIWSF